MKNFRTYVREARMEAGLSQRGLAKQVRMDHGYLSRLESGDRVGSAEMNSRLADALSLPVQARVIAAFENVALQLGVSVEDLMADAQKAQDELAADPGAHSKLSSMGVLITRECSDACCAVAA